MILGRVCVNFSDSLVDAGLLLLLDYYAGEHAARK